MRLILIGLFLFSCTNKGREISSIDIYNNYGGLDKSKSFSARLLTFTSNYRQITITGNCNDNNGPITFDGIALEKPVRSSTVSLPQAECVEGVYAKSLVLKNGLSTGYDILAFQGKESATVNLTFVDTSRPAKVIIRTPLTSFKHGRTIYFTGGCEHRATVYIRSFYIEDLVKSMPCRNGIFLLPIYLKNIDAQDAHIFFAINQVDESGNSSDFIFHEIEYHKEEHSIYLDEKIVGITNGEISISGNCRSYDKVSVSGKLVPCINDRFEYQYSVESLEEAIAYHLTIQGVNKNKSSNVRYLFFYRKDIRATPQFYSPKGQYHKADKGRLAISGTCGPAYGKTIVKFTNANGHNLLIDRDYISTDPDGKFYVTAEELDLGEQTKIYGECMPEFVKYQDKQFTTSFSFSDLEAQQITKQEVNVNEFFFSVSGDCYQNAIVNIRDVRSDTLYKVDCINGIYSITLSAGRPHGTTVFEIYENDVFTGITGVKSIARIHYDLYVQYPQNLSVEASAPNWGSLNSTVRVYWQYPEENEIKELQYGFYSKESLIQVNWKSLPSGTSRLFVNGRDLVRMGYKECSPIQLFLQARDKNERYSSILKSQFIRFDFTPPELPTIDSIDYTPIFKGLLPTFYISSLTDNCVSSSRLWFHVKVYRYYDYFSKKEVVDDFFINDLKEINKYQIKYQKEGAFQVGFKVFDLGLNFSPEYLSVIFSWK